MRLRSYAHFPDIYLTIVPIARSGLEEYDFGGMDDQYSEKHYPITFRSRDAKVLGEHLKHRHSVELVGMKHVGIGNFLQFFLGREGVVPTYISPHEKHMFIPVELNDLVEKDIFAFWTLTFKRLVDTVDVSITMGESEKKAISGLFLKSIQSKNLFLTQENLRDAIKLILKSGILPTIFFVRFDRISDVVSEEFLANLEGLRDASEHKLAFVITSFRALDDLAPDVFTRKSLSVFSHLMYIRGAKEEDMQIIYKTLDNKYKLGLSEPAVSKLIKICGAHVQYLQIAMVVLKSLLNKDKEIKESDFANLLVKDERVGLISEEIWDSLTDSEKNTVKRIIEGVETNGEISSYLTETGVVVADGERKRVFSVLFESFVKGLLKNGDGEAVDFTKKEHLLFNLLKDNLGQICERETIIKVVWPEYEDLDVSDWTVDQLVSRLRNKLKKQKSNFLVKTVKTRGYRMVEES